MNEKGEERDYQFKTNVLGQFLIRNERKTPLKNIIENISNLSEEQSKLSLVVLLATGSFNPIHNGHINMMKSAKKHLEETVGGFVVVGGFLSTSHLDYLSQKLGSHALSNEDRCKLIELCIEGNGRCKDWLHVDAAECEHKSFSSIPQILETLGQYIRQRIPEKEIRVMYVCGKDLFIGCYGFTSFQTRKNGVVMVDRPSSEEWYKFVEGRILENCKDNKNVFVVKNEEVEEVTKNLSSTSIRQLMVEKKEEVILKENLVPSSCVEYMKKRELFDEPEN